MNPSNKLLIFLSVLIVALLSACSDDSTDLKQKIAEIDKKLQKQEKDLREFSGKFAPPKDFSADIQRLEDQAERVSETLKTRLDPMSGRLEEFRDWAQDSQKDRDAVREKLKQLDAAVNDLKKKLEAKNKDLAAATADSAAAKKVSSSLGKSVEDLSKAVAEVRKELQDSNAKIVNAVKKTLPKVKDAAVAELKEKIQPLEEGLSSIKTGIESEKKDVAGRATALGADAGKLVQGLHNKIRELEDVVSAQKSALLEIGAKLHELEKGRRQ